MWFFSYALTEYILFAVSWPCFQGWIHCEGVFMKPDLSCFTAQVLHSSPPGLHTPWENGYITHNKTPNRVGHWSIFFTSGIRRLLCQRKMCMHYESINLGFGWCQQLQGFSSIHAPFYENFKGESGCCEVVLLWRFCSICFLTGEALEGSAVYWLELHSYKYFYKKLREDALTATDRDKGCWTKNIFKTACVLIVKPFLIHYGQFIYTYTAVSSAIKMNTNNKSELKSVLARLWNQSCF